MHRDAVHRRTHGVFAHTVVDVAAAEFAGAHRLHPVHDGEVGVRQVRRTADQFREGLDQNSQRVLAGLAGGKRRTCLGQFLLEGGDRRLRVGRQHAGLSAQERDALDVGRRFQPLLPGESCRPAACARSAPCVEDRFRNLERGVRPAELFPRARNLGRAERRPVRALLALLGGGAVADDGATGDQRRARVGARRLDRRGNRLRIVAVHRECVPAIGGEPRRLVVRHRQAGRPVDRNMIVIEQHDQPAKAEMPGE